MNRTMSCDACSYANVYFEEQLGSIKKLGIGNTLNCLGSKKADCVRLQKD